MTTSKTEVANCTYYKTNIHLALEVQVIFPKTEHELESQSTDLNLPRGRGGNLTTL